MMNPSRKRASRRQKVKHDLYEGVAAVYNGMRNKAEVLASCGKGVEAIPHMLWGAGWVEWEKRSLENVRRGLARNGTGAVASQNARQADLMSSSSSHSRFCFNSSIVIIF